MIDGWALMIGLIILQRKGKISIKELFGKVSVLVQKLGVPQDICLELRAIAQVLGRSGHRLWWQVRATHWELVGKCTRLLWLTLVRLLVRHLPPSKSESVVGYWLLGQLVVGCWLFVLSLSAVVSFLALLYVRSLWCLDGGWVYLEVGEKNHVLTDGSPMFT